MPTWSSCIGSLLLPGRRGAGGGRRRPRLAFSFPRRIWWMRLGASAVNVYLAARSMELSFIHRATGSCGRGKRRPGPVGA